MVRIERWTGREVRALREAKRMSLAVFAAHLGISERSVSYWEKKGEAAAIRAVNQAALDTSLQVSDPGVHHRMASCLNLPAEPNGTAVTVADNEHGDLLLTQQKALPTDEKQMALIDSGTYLSGEGQSPIWLPAYYIDTFPVTNREYSRFVVATGHQTPDHWSKGKYPDRISDHPVTYVTWHDAKSYASWAGKELPSSQQWEKAARGAKGHTYPWGNQKTPAKCNVRESDIGNTTPVSRYHSGVSQFGVYDLCGNVWEWCDTRTEPGRYELKGGAFTSPFSRATPQLFNDADVAMLDDDTGFRCAIPAAVMDRQR